VACSFRYFAIWALALPLPFSSEKKKKRGKTREIHRSLRMFSCCGVLQVPERQNNKHATLRRALRTLFYSALVDGTGVEASNVNTLKERP
jgi:hypothetical protein